MKITNKHIILYVDDDQDDLEMLNRALECVESDYHLVEATNGVAGLERLKEMKESCELPCLIVLDINMPKMDGRQTFQHIKADHQLSSIPVVIFSTSNSELDKKFFHGKKGVEYITKPINLENLVTIATRMLHHCKASGTS